jgi:predicted nucleotidyltransferase
LYHRIVTANAPNLPDIGQRASRVAGLDLLLLFGSRARGDAADGADWDFGYLAAVPLDADGLLAVLVEATGSDRVDLVDLDRASGLLRHRAAVDGVVVFEGRPGLADRFRLAAARFWCDAAPVLDRAYSDLLAELKR